MSKETLTLTYRTRLPDVAEVHRALQASAKLLSKVERNLFAEMMKGETSASLKKSFLKRFDITARHFNACRVQIEGKIASRKQLDAMRIESLKTAAYKLEKRLSSKRLRNKVKAWNQKQRLNRLREKLAGLERDLKDERVRLCFGSRKLFRSQFTGELSHDEWKQKWEDSRSREFFLLGSKDETAGNQSCTAVIAPDHSLTLRLRLPHGINQGKYLEITDVRFAYGHDIILAALQENLLRKELFKAKDPSFKEHGQAISYRFLNDEKGWTIFVSTTLPEPHWITNSQLGRVGIDINADHLAVVETDRFGNPIHHESIPCSLYGKSQQQSKAIIGDACAKAVEIAKRAKKPLVIEELDFSRKKRNLKENSVAQRRMLSSFAYSSIVQNLRSRAYRLGVQLYSVNPAFTSLIGRIKFAARYGLTTHMAAALCIARRHLGFSESLPAASSVPDDRGGYIAFSVPARNQEKHEWQFLQKVKKKLQATLAEYIRATRCRSLSPPKEGFCDALSNLAGETPARESLATLLG
jgi:IS605 OrfB family transposase